MLRLVIANKRYSSWSMRPWLILRAAGIAFDETVIALKQPDTAAKISAYSPSGKLPVLIDGDQAVWESLAIIEHAAERFSDRRIWPIERAARSVARAISSEMHGGFMPLRQACPMNLRTRFETPQLSDDVVANIARIEKLWAETRETHGAGGPFLFGQFSAADAMFAPVAVRFDTYQTPVTETSRAYMAALFAHPAFTRWRNEALTEPWTIAEYEAGHRPVADGR